MRKREIFALSALSFSIGIVFGFLISPVKNGFVNNAGNKFISNYYDKKNSTDDESK